MVGLVCHIAHTIDIAMPCHMPPSLPEYFWAMQLWCAVMARNYEWTLTNPEAKVIRGVFMTFEDGLEIDIRRLPTDS